MSGDLKHFANQSFWEKFELLPEKIKKIAKNKFEILKKDRNHPSLHFKKVKNYCSVRITKNYRAIGIIINEGIVWFWIGKHKDYEKLLKQWD